MKYSDEDDKCYGVTGMAIGISIWNGEDMLYKIDIDDEDNGYILFTPDYYFRGNPAISPVESWHHTLKHYQMTVGMLIANLMCRSLKKGGMDFGKAKKTLFDMVAEEGRSACQLEDDEIRRMFQDTFSYLEQVFHNRSVRAIAHEFAKRLKESRSLSNYEIKELLGMIEPETA